MYGWSLLSLLTIFLVASYGDNYSKPATVVFDDEILDGVECGNTSKTAWLDLVVVVESSQATARQWSNVVSNMLSYLSYLSLSNTLTLSKTTRVAIVTYTKMEANLIYAFTDTQSLRNIEFALHQNKPPVNAAMGSSLNSGLREAKHHVEANRSFRLPTVLIYAATYDTSWGDPIEAVELLKSEGYSIITVTISATNGIIDQRIAELASPGMNLITSYNTSSDFNSTIILANCRCPVGWNQLTINETLYGECFRVTNASQSSRVLSCPDGSIPATLYTPNRFQYVADLLELLYYTEDKVYRYLPFDECSVGLHRNHGMWYWVGYDDPIPYNNIPPFDYGPPLDNATYGYLFTNGHYIWLLRADSGLAPYRSVLCQTRACSVNYFCNFD